MLDKLKKNYFILIVTFLFTYFFFNLLDGERGLISYMEKKEIYDIWLDELKVLEKEYNKFLIEKEKNEEEIPKVVIKKKKGGGKKKK